VEKIIWSDAALGELNDIYDLIRADSKSYADKMVDAFFDRVEILLSQPKIGRVIPEMEDPQYREIMLGNYRIMYFVGNLPTIQIYRIMHFSRLFEQ
jgi:toxin ParE1/3/4